MKHLNRNSSLVLSRLLNGNHYQRADEHCHGHHHATDWWVCVCFFCVIALLSARVHTATAQSEAGAISGLVRVRGSGKPIAHAQILLYKTRATTVSDAEGRFRLPLTNVPTGKYLVVAHAEEFKTQAHEIELSPGTTYRIDFELDTLGQQTLEDIVVYDRQTVSADRTRLRGVEGAIIYEGKKTEVVVLEHVVGNTATNNPRQVFSKVSGLTIWESDGAGLQLNIGARGLSPQRTSNFNTRQNGYDMSADALGYPESYYTPPTEALQRIEVVRGAASLQYGTQFGGMINFVLKKPTERKPYETLARATGGTLGFGSAFVSHAGSANRVSWYGFYNFKTGQSWRPNTGFQVHTAHAALGWHPNKRLSVWGEYTYMRYVAQQPGGLTDALYAQNPRQSIRDRNFFAVHWNLLALQADYVFSDRLKLNSRCFGLIANRFAVGVLGQINRPDPLDERDLLKDYFRNVGNETRLLWNYSLGQKQGFLSTGVRYYTSNSSQNQGTAPAGSSPDFVYIEGRPDRLSYTYPSHNLSIFAENAFFLNSRLSITPGIRYEFIRTEADGFYTNIARDLAGNIIFNQQVNDRRVNQRGFVLAGVGVSYKFTESIETYTNFSQNYRAVTFSDLRVQNPNFVIDTTLKDETGFNYDLGIRGQVGRWFDFDASLFYLSYTDRIGNVLRVDPTTFNIYRFRTNVGDAYSLGMELFSEVNLIRLLRPRLTQWDVSVFVNASLVRARYKQDQQNTAIAGKQIENAPAVSVRTGGTLRWKTLKLGGVVTLFSDQYSDATNALTSPTAVNGLIPGYSVLDLTAAYTWRWLTLTCTLNNALDARFFTYRASGYPGPGIMPADGRALYGTLEVRF
jgi:Fe(3+) dicitrate transport protein